ncbi:MAG: DNA polymerase I [Elusimicrobia bacterium]|nr:DNA polymerase I [Elusimicrobiota bacterium]
MRPRLYLVDAHAYLHRAYHALPPLTSSKGEPVGALLGFARMLLKLIREEKPERVAVCFDSPGPTFRHEAFAAYKATRKETDQDLVSQLDLAPELAAALGCATVRLQGYEADDLMATLASRAAREGFDAVLVTGDKDALQMVGEGVRVLDPGKGVWMDPPRIEEKLGVGPSAVVDYLALAGDASDNVPGVRGIGPVGARKLLKDHGTLEGVLKAAKAGDPRIPPKTAEALLAGADDVLAAAELVRLRRDAPIDAPPRSPGAPVPDLRLLKPVLERLEFHSLLKELSGDGADAPSSRAPSGGASALVGEGLAPLQEADLATVLKEAARSGVLTLSAVANDSPDLIESGPALVALGSEDGRTALLHGKDAARHQRELSHALAGKAIKVCWDVKAALAALGSLGLALKPPVFDAMLAAYCLDPASEPGKPAKELDAELRRRAGLALGRPALLDAMRGQGVLKLFSEIELPLLWVLRDMEEAGIAVDAGYLRTLSGEFDGHIRELKAEVDRLAGAEINLNSPKQLGLLLYDKLQLPVAHKTAKGGRSTDEAALATLAGLHPIPAKVIEYRELAKLKATYIEGLLERVVPATGRVHTHFDQSGTATGRLSSLDPNLQNIPVRSVPGQKIRRAFVAGPGMELVSADYSQIDLRVLAHVSDDRALQEAFAADQDIHERTAREVFHLAPGSVDKEHRRRAKAIVFGIVYGQSAHGLAQSLGIPRSEAADYIKKCFERYDGVARWAAANLHEARRTGLVRTWTGRIRRLPDLSAKNTAVRQFAERAATNTPIQGGSADVIKVAMLRVQDALKAEPGRFKARMLLQIHDELLFEVPQDRVGDFAPWVRGAMETAVSLKVPLKVDVKTGPNWVDMRAP